MKLKIVLEPSDEGGFTALVPSLPGCISEGDTREQALANIKEAIELYLEPVEDDMLSLPKAEVIELAVWQKYPASIMNKLSGHCSGMAG